jgi:hypothetical protein
MWDPNEKVPFPWIILMAASVYAVFLLGSTETGMAFLDCLLHPIAKLDAMLVEWIR